MPRRAKHPSARTRRNLDGPEWRKLPSEGRGRKAAPAWPLQPDRQLRLAVDAAKSEVGLIETAIEGTEDRKDRIALARELRREKSRLAALQGDVRLVNREELKLWRELWKKPQAVLWELDGAERTVAQYVRFKLRAEMGELGAARHIIQLDAKLGISPKAMHDLRWEVAVDELDERRERDERAGGPSTPRPAATPTGTDPRLYAVE